MNDHETQRQLLDMLYVSSDVIDAYNLPSFSKISLGKMFFLY